MSEQPTYRIVRFRQEGPPHETVETGLTLEEAQAWCQREDTHGDGWFDGYTMENPDDAELARRDEADERLLRMLQIARRAGL